jgi:hypothetical protein
MEDAFERARRRTRLRGKIWNGILLLAAISAAVIVLVGLSGCASRCDEWCKITQAAKGRI